MIASRDVTGADHRAIPATGTSQDDVEDFVIQLLDGLSPDCLTKAFSLELPAFHHPASTEVLTMRLRRFESFLHELLTKEAAPAVQSVRTFSEAGYRKRPAGIVLGFTNGGEVYLQVVRTSPSDGSDQREEEPIVTGEPPAAVPPVELSAAGAVRTADIERWLVSVLANSGHNELARVNGYSATKDLGDGQQPYGVRVSCHSEAAIYLLFLHTLRSGQSASGNDFQVLEAV
ncbi:hypothetical protein DEF23_25290 [Marinitenerispora sediminis]|uniref:Uncharacterized protein n=2 Tax=Marinitenerispora sediminis TaxID=1931232 RepID=A0A368T9K0_9ACTN|nr:hypothetical protein DEF28_25440 [Marinitenerispora sediminis]RCV48257.1 hypothetical protein DEF23_25290 [Marinitenerispora sediminis]RCV60954.1 hypothetical protein DEF24_05390 [Marinitenerispora sediminis]